MGDEFIQDKSMNETCPLPKTGKLKKKKSWKLNHKKTKFSRFKFA